MVRTRTIRLTPMIRPFTRIQHSGLGVMGIVKTNGSPVGFASFVRFRLNTAQADTVGFTVSRPNRTGLGQAIFACHGYRTRLR